MLALPHAFMDELGTLASARALRGHLGCNAWPAEVNSMTKTILVSAVCLVAIAGCRDRGHVDVDRDREGRVGVNVDKPNVDTTTVTGANVDGAPANRS